MKKLILIYGLLASSFSFGADWVYVTESSDADADYYIDRSHYRYITQKGEVEVWYKRNQFEGLNEYTESKVLNVFDCINKREKTIALVAYTPSGQSNQIINKPTPYSVIFPDTIGEDLWLAACKTKGKGLYLPHKSNFISEKRMKLLGLKD